MMLAVMTAALFCSAAPAQAQVGIVAPVQVAGENDWRYKYHNNQWWYYTPQQQWMVHDGNSWNAHNPAIVSSGSGGTYFQGGQNYQTPYQSGYRGNTQYNNGYYNGGQYYGGPYNNGYGQYYNGNGYGQYYGNGYNSGYGGNIGTNIGGAIVGRVLGLGR